MATIQSNLIINKLMKLPEKYYLKVKELSSAIKDAWKVFILGSIISFLIILLLVKENGQKSSLTLLQKSAQFGASTGPSIITMTPDPSTSKPTISAPPIASIMADSLADQPISASTLISASPPIASLFAGPPMVSILPVPSIIGEPLDKQNLPTEIVNNNNVEKSMKKKCDIFDGRWVYKADATASYCVLKCPFVEEKMSCQSNGRPDFEYEKWVWEARDCDIEVPM